MGSEDLRLQSSLLSYHLGQLRTTASVTGGFLALYKFAGTIGEGGDVIRKVSMAAFFLMAVVLFLSGREYAYLVRRATEEGDIPPKRALSMSRWTYVSYGISAGILAIGASLFVLQT
nr:hypothetical protein TetV2_00522 [Oceanusvirus sp.]